MVESFADRVDLLVEEECNRQGGVVRRALSGRPFAFRFSWSMRGSAGRAVLWLRQQDQTLPPAEMVELLAERCDAEVQAHPRLYTKSHLLGVIEIAGREAERWEMADA